MEDDEMIQRELIEQECVFRQVVVPDGCGGHTAIYVWETQRDHFRLHNYKRFIEEERYV